MNRKFLLATFAIASFTLAACGQSPSPEESAPDPNSASPAPENASPQSSSATESNKLPERDCDSDGLMDRPYDLDGDGAEDGCDINHGSAE